MLTIREGLHPFEEKSQRRSSMYVKMTRKTENEDAATYSDALIACPDFLLSTLSLTVSELIEQALVPLGLRLRDYRVLRLLYFDGPQLQVGLGPALRVDRTTVVALVDKLEQKKLAKRTRCTDDRRAYRVSLTPKGERLTGDATRLVNAVEETLFAPLDQSERSMLRTLSTRLLSEPGLIAQAHAATPREHAPIAPEGASRPTPSIRHSP